MKTIRCNKNRSTKIISNFGRGYPQQFLIRIVADDGSTLSGKYLEKRYLWIFPQTPKEGPLQSKMEFNRKWINGIYSVSIIPECDVTVYID